MLNIRWAGMRQGLGSSAPRAEQLFSIVSFWFEGH